MLIADCRCPTCGGDLPDTDLVVDLGTNTAIRNGMVVTLPPMGAELLYLLAKAAPRIISRDSLISGVWGGREPENVDSAIRVKVSRLRQDIEPLGLTIITAKHQGYGLRKMELFDGQPTKRRSGAVGRMIEAFA